MVNLFGSEETRDLNIEEDNYYTFHNIRCKVIVGQLIHVSTALTHHTCDLVKRYKEFTNIKILQFRCVIKYFKNSGCY